MTAPPAWLNLDAVVTSADRDEIKKLVEEARDKLLPLLAEWGQRTRDVLGTLNTTAPGVLWEVEEIQELIGLDALNDVMFVIGAMGANPAGTPDFKMLARLREEYPQYAELLE
jgi:O6-methylguanine-DNA--protein-cysteine methyltransferase